MSSLTSNAGSALLLQQLQQLRSPQTLVDDFLLHQTHSPHADAKPVEDKPRSASTSLSTSLESRSANDQLSTQAEDEASNICSVCNDEASGRHYGAFTCFGCKGFFRRTVRANKVYTCRYEQQCQIDKVGRNICRSCRFKKCLEVGMEPDAIRPDRDKTGRQKNPRRSANSFSSTRSELLLAEEGGRKSPESSASSQSGEDMRSHCETMAPSSAAMAQRDLILDTLIQIEHICAELSEDPNPAFHMETDALLDDLIQRPSLIGERTPLNFSAQQPLRDAVSFTAALKRLVITQVDYVNTLKPIADVSVQEKVSLLRSFVPSLTILSTVHKSVSEGQLDRVLLPNGQFVDGNTSIQLFFDGIDGKDSEWLEAKIKFVRNALLTKLVPALEQAHLLDQEFVCLKALLALDPNVAGLSDRTSKVLEVARDSVQNALYLYLADRLPVDEAVLRLGRLLLLISNVSKVGAFFSSAMQLAVHLHNDRDSLLAQLFTA